jgi:hypothetical protein
MNYVQDRFAGQSEADHAEVVRLCCVIKPLVTWHGENTGKFGCQTRFGFLLLIMNVSAVVQNSQRVP